MRRRDFIALAGASAAWPLAAKAQPARPVPRGPGGRPWRIAALVIFTQAQSDLEVLGPFRQGLADLGYVEGRDFVLEARYDDGDASRHTASAKELVRFAPDVIFAQSTPAILALRQETTSVPIISVSIDPTQLDFLVGNLARPTGNVTGLVTEGTSLVAKHCELARELVPGAKTVGIMVWALSADGGAATRTVFTTTAQTLGLTPIVVEVSHPPEIPAAFRSLRDAGANVIVVGNGSVFAADRPATVEGAAAVRLPAIYNQRGYVEAGGLISYSTLDRRITSIRVASFADRILRGARPIDLPVEQPSSFTMAVNLKTAKALGLTIPPTVLFRADIVVE
jgi:putative ABC transport system substrate-binding protein